MQNLYKNIISLRETYELSIPMFYGGKTHWSWKPQVLQSLPPFAEEKKEQKSSKKNTRWNPASEFRAGKKLFAIQKQRIKARENSRAASEFRDSESGFGISGASLVRPALCIRWLLPASHIYLVPYKKFFATHMANTVVILVFLYSWKKSMKNQLFFILFFCFHCLPKLFLKFWQVDNF